MEEFPSLFVSHGAPTLALQDSPARRFLLDLGPRLPRPRAIVVVSAHHDSRGVEVTGSKTPETIHDFGGFPQELYDLAYPAPGEPELSAAIVELLGAAEIQASINPTRGLDHGAWVPLMLLYPGADIPVVQLSIDMAQTPRYHLKLGQALSPLRHRGRIRARPGTSSVRAALRTTCESPLAGTTSTTAHRRHGLPSSRNGSPSRSRQGKPMPCCTPSTGDRTGDATTRRWITSTRCSSHTARGQSPATVCGCVARLPTVFWRWMCMVSGKRSRSTTCIASVAFTASVRVNRRSR